MDEREKNENLEPEEPEIPEVSEESEPAEMPEDAAPAEEADAPTDAADEPVELDGMEDDPEPEEDAGESEPAEVPETADTSEEPLEPQDPPAEEPAGTPAEEPDNAAEKKMTRAEKKEKRKAEKAEKAARPRRSDRLGFRVGVRLIAVLIVILLALGAFYFGYSIFNQKPVTESGDPETYVITVDEGEDIASIASELKEAGMIRSVIIMRIQDKIFDYGLVPGDYEVNSGMNSLQILSWISDPNHTLADSPENVPAQPETQALPPAETETETAAPEEGA
ncbi:MAG: hypothetical protein IKD88_07645 [Lachnospiraceae bacterium]|nr:hypothetical protein [Lachnospiraceae bacterium]